MFTQSVCILTDSFCWRNPSTTAKETNKKPESRMGHTTVYDPVLRCIYLYGGSKNLQWFNDIHMLCCDEWEWNVVKVSTAVVILAKQISRNQSFVLKTGRNRKETAFSVIYRTN